MSGFLSIAGLKAGLKHLTLYIVTKEFNDETNTVRPSSPVVSIPITKYRVLCLQVPTPIAESSRLSLLTGCRDISLPSLPSMSDDTSLRATASNIEQPPSQPAAPANLPADGISATVGNYTALSDLTKDPSQLPAPDTAPLPDERFMEVDVAVRSILDCQEPLDCIPHGTKENVYMIIRNDRNFERRQKGKHSEFVDDCGVWDSACGTAPKFTYVADKNLGLCGLTKVYVRDGNYCTQHMVKRKTTYIPVDPQPDEDDILEVRRVYSALKKDKGYRRRVTYVTKMPPHVNDTLPALALVEYMGDFPGGAPHGNNKCSARPYVRTPGQVLEDIAVAVQDTAPRAVYKRMERENAEDSAPRNLRQVQSVKARTKQKDRQDDDGPVTVGNLAQQIQRVESLVHHNPFVQATWQGKGASPSVILHTDEQLQDLKRFCCSSPAGQTTVLGFDKTFNLTEVHVTMAVYKNLAMYSEGTQNHPIMLGPMFIHGTSDYETYSVFFDYLKRKMRQCSSQPVLGSDDEKAMRKAMKDAFPESGSLVCERHLKQNAADYLTNNVGVSNVRKQRVINSLFGTQGLSDAVDLVTFELRSEKARDVIGVNAPGFMDYFISRIERLMKDNLQVSITPSAKGTTDWTVLTG